MNIPVHIINSRL